MTQFRQLADEAPLEPGRMTLDLRPDRLQFDSTDPVHAQVVWEDAQLMRLLAERLRVPRIEFSVGGEPYAEWTANPLPLPSSSSSRGRSQR